MGKQVIDRSSMHRYRTEIPNIIDDMDLSVYAFRLYVRLKRVAGDDGKCFYTTRQLAEQCRMSVGAISKAKQELVEKDLIRVDSDGKWVRDNITIVDMWPANFAYFAQEKEEQCQQQNDTSQKYAQPAETNFNAYQHGAERSGAKSALPLEESTSGLLTRSVTDWANEQSQKADFAPSAENLASHSTTSYPSQKAGGQEYTTSNFSASHATTESTRQARNACSPHEQGCSSHEHPVHHTNESVRTVNVKEEPIKEEPIKEGGETSPARPAKELRSRNAINGASKKIRFESPHVNNSRFDAETGYIPAGSGTTAVEIFYERFDICANDQRLTAPMEEDLVRNCPDLEKLREVIVAYSRAGFRNQRNVQLILDWYRQGIPDKYSPPGAPKKVKGLTKFLEIARGQGATI